MAQPNPLQLSRRERQIMDILYARSQASVTDVLEAMPDPPSYSAVRAMLRMLEEKGHVRHKEEGRKFIYVPTVPADKARHSALRNLLRTFFGGSAAQAVASLIEMDKRKLSADDLDRLTLLIEQAKKEGR